MSLVLEHIPDPAALLALAHGQLDDGGLLCVVVPNDFNPFQLVARDHLEFNPWWVAPPHHINYFNFSSLQKLLERCGFEVIHKEATFPIDMFLLMGDNYIGNDELGRACHGKRKMLELNLSRAGMAEIKRHLYQSLANIGLGREVVLIARKLEQVDLWLRLMSKEPWKCREFETIKCPVCACIEYETVYQCHQETGYTLGRIQTSFVVCKDCGFLFQNPRPRLELLMRHYEENIEASGSVYHDPGPDASHDTRQKARRVFYKKYFNEINNGALLEVSCSNRQFLLALGSNGWKLTGLEASGKSRRVRQY